MKHLNQKTEGIIETQVNCVDFKNETKVGEVVPHYERVENIKIYVPQYNNNGIIVNYIQVTFQRDEILDLARQIESIESKHFDEEYESPLPF